MKIEIHIIHSVPTSRLNTDRNGRPKTIIYGGYKRARISSQAQKRAARMFTDEHGLIDASQQAYRSRLIPQKAIEALRDNDTDETTATLLVTRAFAALGMKLNDNGQNEYMLFHSHRELHGFVAAIREHRKILLKTRTEAGGDKKVQQQKFPEPTRQALKSLFLTERALEVALYGRQLTDLPEGTVDGQVQVMHALSVHTVLDEEDFFSAVDDYETHTHGASGMLREIGISAPTYYRMAAVNVGQLAVEVNSPEAALTGARAFIEAFVMTLPLGGRNSFSSLTIPQFVMLQRIDAGEALNMSPAFERPLITPPSISMSDRAVEILDGYIKRIERAYPRLQGRKRVCFNVTGVQTEIAPTVDSLDQAISTILE